MISSLKSTEGLITAQDYISSFYLFDMDFGKSLLPIFTRVDYEIALFKQEERDRKSDSKKPKK